MAVVKIGFFKSQAQIQSIPLSCRGFRRKHAICVASHFTLPSIGNQCQSKLGLHTPLAWRGVELRVNCSVREAAKDPPVGEEGRFRDRPFLNRFTQRPKGAQGRRRESLDWGFIITEEISGSVVRWTGQHTKMLRNLSCIFFSIKLEFLYWFQFNCVIRSP